MTFSPLAAALSCLLLVTLVTTSHAEVLRDNGPFVTHPEAHVSGEDVSIAQDVTYPGYTALGITAGPLYRLTDDFIIPNGEIWTIDSVILYAYQTGTGDADFSDARVIIWEGFPDNTNSIKVFDGSLANALTSTTPAAYRIAQSAEATAPFTNTERRIKALDIAIPPFDLDGGQYWVDWRLTGSVADAQVFTPPASILGQPYTTVNGVARRKNPENGDWQTFNPGSNPNYTVDLPFTINGMRFFDRIFRDGFDTVTPTP